MLNSYQNFGLKQEFLRLSVLFQFLVQSECLQAIFKLLKNAFAAWCSSQPLLLGVHASARGRCCSAWRCQLSPSSCWCCLAAAYSIVSQEKHALYFFLLICYICVHLWAIKENFLYYLNSNVITGLWGVLFCLVRVVFKCCMTWYY